MDRFINKENKIIKTKRYKMPEIKQSKPIKEVKQGDKIKIDGKEYEVDAHYILIENKDPEGNAVNEIF